MCEREGWRKENANHFGGSAVGFPHWLYFKGISPAWAALIYGHFKWSLLPFFFSDFLFSCQPFQHSLLFWNWFSSFLLERKFGLFGFRAPRICFCVCNKCRKSWSSPFHCNSFHSPLVPLLSVRYYFFFLTIRYSSTLNGKFVSPSKCI